MADLKDKVIFITGASRGIGRSIALRAAEDGARIVVCAKTAEPHPKLPGTIHTVAEEIKAAGGDALAVQLDIRFEEQIQAAVDQAVAHFGGIDILVNNASAISLTPTDQTPMKRFDLMFGVNVRGTFACSQACLPHLKKADNAHILNLAPPLNMKAKWFKNHVAYTMSKYGMSMCTLGMAEEFKPHDIAVNSLWPITPIATAAIAVNFPKEVYDASRQPEIMGEAAHHILCQPSSEVTGNFFLDEDVLREHGVNDFKIYAVNPDANLMKDFFLD
jgi:citronellol/citronellal dehydrogenase